MYKYYVVTWGYVKDHYETGGCCFEPFDTLEAAKKFADSELELYDQNTVEQYAEVYEAESRTRVYVTKGVVV